PVPIAEDQEKWRYRLTVDLQWEPAGEGREPWVGRIVGKAVPEATVLQGRTRNANREENDHGGVTDKGWYPWCAMVFNTKAWPTWPVELRGLQFEHEGAQIEQPPVPAWVTNGTPQVQGPTFDVDGQLKTIAFTMAKVAFQENDGPAESMYFSCGGKRGPSGH